MMRWFARQEPALTLSDLDHAALPVLDAPTLIALLGQHNRVRTLRRLAAVDTTLFAQLYEPALYQFIEAAQLQPASASDHHAGLGGLVIHTLDVIERAMRCRKQYMLPQNASPEQIVTEEVAWTYAVFAAALLHDAAKLLTLTRLMLDSRQPWTPFGPPLGETGATSYRIEFVSAPYALQTRISGTLLYLLPDQGRALLAVNPDILSQFVSWLADDPYEWGVIGDIVRQADGESVAVNRRSGADQVRLPNAPSVPMVERMMRALRQLIYDHELKFNRSGAAGWVEGNYTYLVCGVVANKARERLHQEGSMDVPTDNTRLFDIWQDHGFVVPTEPGRAIWNLSVKGEGFCHHLSCLKFETHKLFHPSRRPEPFNGELVLREGPDRLDTEPGVGTQFETRVEPRIAPSEPNAPRDEAVAQHAVVVSDQPQTAPIKKAPKTAANTSAQSTAPTPSVSPAPTTPVSLDDADIGKKFLDWVRASLQDKTLKVNQTGATVHTVPEGVLIVTPATFKAYLVHAKLLSDNKDAQNKQFRRLQSRLQKLRLHRRTASKYNIFKYRVTGPNASATLYGWLFKPALIYGDRPPPPPNEVLHNVTDVDPDT